jgi:hypothetical protein
LLGFPGAFRLNATVPNKETVSAFAREVIGNKNLDHANTWLADDFVEHQEFPGTTPRQAGRHRFLPHLLRGLARHDRRDPRHDRRR